MIQMIEAEHNKRIGKAILHYRLTYKNPDKETPGITQTKLAKQVNVTFQQIQKYEKGTNGVSSYRLLLISKALRINISDIFVKAYQDNAEILSFCTPFETIAEVNIKDQKPLILKEKWIVNEKEEQN
tara:strand:+ start:41 stop:421 length:381 start_codon:yes stop_codon:yes gene_type:complete